jgi:DNA-binding MarR family transcriptional regulator
LAFRLRELQRGGLIKRFVREGSKKEIFYELTPKGWDAVPILTAFLNFGYRHHADVVFADAKPRTINQVLPGAQCELLGGLASYAVDGSSKRFARGNYDRELKAATRQIGRQNSASPTT